VHGIGAEQRTGEERVTRAGGVPAGRGLRSPSRPPGRGGTGAPAMYRRGAAGGARQGGRGWGRRSPPSVQGTHVPPAPRDEFGDVQHGVPVYRSPRWDVISPSWLPLSVLEHGSSIASRPPDRLTRSPPRPQEPSTGRGGAQEGLPEALRTSSGARIHRELPEKVGKGRAGHTGAWTGGGRPPGKGCRGPRGGQNGNLERSEGAARPPANVPGALIGGRGTGTGCPRS